MTTMYAVPVGLCMSKAFPATLAERVPAFPSLTVAEVDFDLPFSSSRDHARAGDNPLLLLERGEFLRAAGAP